MELGYVAINYWMRTRSDAEGFQIGDAEAAAMRSHSGTTLRAIGFATAPSAIAPAEGTSWRLYND